MIPPGLLLITPELEPALLLARLERLLAVAPVDLLLRAKGKSGRVLLELAALLLPRLQAAGGRLLVGGDPDLALAAGAHGAHLPEAQRPTHAARKLLGTGKLLGRSCHDLAGAQRALAEGADYVTVSPLFATASHPEAEPLGVARFAAMARDLPGPVLALGGITPDNARLALASGARGVALIGAVLAVPDPLPPFLALRKALDDHGLRP